LYTIEEIVHTLEEISEHLQLERRLSLIFDRRFAFLPGSENAKTTRKNNGVHHRSPTIWQFQG
jgi:hypothetical protein